MKTLSLYIMAILVVFKTCGMAFGVELPPICPVPSVSDAPVLDGKIDDAAWRNAYPMGGFVMLGDSQSAVVKQTAFRAVYTADALYVAVECREPDMDKLQTAKQRVYKVDSIEIFVQPKADGRYWQMVVSSDGVREEYPGPKKASDILWDAKVYRGTDFYSMEVKLPFDIFGTQPVSNAAWRFNIARNATTPNSCRRSTWSHLRNGFHEPENFGELVFFGAGIDKLAINREVFKRQREAANVLGREMFKRQYKTADVRIAAYRKIDQRDDKDFYDYITKFLIEIGWEELRQKAAKIDELSPEDVAQATQELEKIAGRLSELDLMRADMIRERMFKH